MIDNHTWLLLLDDSCSRRWWWGRRTCQQGRSTILFPLKKSLNILIMSLPLLLTSCFMIRVISIDDIAQRFRLREVAGFPEFVDFGTDGWKQWDGEAWCIEVRHEKWFRESSVSQYVLLYRISVSKFIINVYQSIDHSMQKKRESLTLARKLEVVHSTTTTIKSAMPRVCRWTPIMLERPERAEGQRKCLQSRYTVFKQQNTKDSEVNMSLRRPLSQISPVSCLIAEMQNLTSNRQ